jgi:hypothetical protein
LFHGPAARTVQHVSAMIFNDRDVRISWMAPRDSGEPVTSTVVRNSTNQVTEASGLGFIGYEISHNGLWDEDEDEREVKPFNDLTGTITQSMKNAAALNAIAIADGSESGVHLVDDRGAFDYTPRLYTFSYQLPAELRGEDVEFQVCAVYVATRVLTSGTAGQSGATYSVDTFAHGEAIKVTAKARSGKDSVAGAARGTNTAGDALNITVTLPEVEEGFDDENITFTAFHIHATNSTVIGNEFGVLIDDINPTNGHATIDKDVLTSGSFAAGTYRFVIVAQNDQGIIKSAIFSVVVTA